MFFVARIPIPKGQVCRHTIPVSGDCALAPHAVQVSKSSDITRSKRHFLVSIPALTCNPEGHRDDALCQDSMAGGVRVSRSGEVWKPVLSVSNGLGYFASQTGNCCPRNRIERQSAARYTRYLNPKPA